MLTIWFKSLAAAVANFCAIASFPWKVVPPYPSLSMAVCCLNSSCLLLYVFTSLGVATG